MTVAVIQLNSTHDKARNLSLVEHWMAKVYQACQPQLVTLPEMFAFMGGTADQKQAAAEDIEATDKTIALLKQLAKQYHCHIHGGSIREFKNGKYYNTSVIIDPNGQQIAIYRKINLFNFNSANVQYNESSHLTAGNEVVIYPINEFTAGCGICFDIRFGQLFQELIAKQVDLIVIPSAFTYETGKAHWETLCRARAIETQSYLIAPAQTGEHEENGQLRRCYGHSMIIDPWGNIIAQLNEEVGFMHATISKEFLSQIRSRLPCVITYK